MHLPSLTCVQERSFCEFASRPENQHLVQQAQTEEIEKKLRADERLKFLEFKEKARNLCPGQRSMEACANGVWKHVQEVPFEAFQSNLWLF